MTEEDLDRWYRTKYDTEHQTSIGHIPYSDRFDRDYGIAKSRLEQYDISGRVLDVGCGNGAFVQACQDAGLDADGTSLVGDDRFYHGHLRSISFPTSSFDAVCYHDVLEHVVDLVAEMHEIKRILKPGGRIVIDFPRFWHEAGTHHWREIEHLWMLTPDQIANLLMDFGFEMEKAYNPIPSKIVYIAKLTKEDPKTLLLLPGMGDIYWVAVKIASWARDNHPKIKIWNFDGRPRSEDYVKRIPFFEHAGYCADLQDKVPEFNEAYMKAGRTWFPKILGHDFLVSYNGTLRTGKSLNEVDAHLPCEWNLPLFQPLAERKAGKEFAAQYGRYIVAYVSDMGMFRQWVRDWDRPRIVAALRKIEQGTGCRIILTGSSWDKAFNDAVAAEGKTFVNLCGQTNLDQLFGLLRNAQGVFGWCGGNTIQAAGLGIPTAMVWNRYFTNEGFFRNCVDPSAKYIPIHQSHCSAESAVSQFLGLLK